jgi:hypothetical protein
MRLRRDEDVVEERVVSMICAWASLYKMNVKTQLALMWAGIILLIAGMMCVTWMDTRNNHSKQQQANDTIVCDTLPAPPLHIMRTWWQQR